MQSHNIMMQIKQLKSIINANYFSPWSMQPEEEDILSPAPNRGPLPFPKFKKYADAVHECLDRKTSSIEEQAKKTLLNIDDDLRRKKIPSPRKRKPEVESVFPQGISQLKLPPINGLIDYTHCCVLQNDIQLSNLTSLDDSFRRMGEFKGRGKPAALGRNLSDVSPVREDISIMTALKRKFETIAVTHDRNKDFSLKKDLKLRGKRFSLDERGTSSERLLEIDRGSYIPKRPNITPHRLLIGHKQDEVLKKVLQQLHGRSK